MIYILSSLVVVLVIFITLLLFCLCSKRDLSPCPKSTNFGRRFTQVRRNVRGSVAYVRQRARTGFTRSNTETGEPILEEEEDLTQLTPTSPPLGKKTTPTPSPRLN